MNRNMGLLSPAFLVMAGILRVGSSRQTSILHHNGLQTTDRFFMNAKAKERNLKENDDLHVSHKCQIMMELYEFLTGVKLKYIVFRSEFLSIIKFACV